VENIWDYQGRDNSGVEWRIFGTTRDEITVEWSGEYYIMRSLMICTPHPIFFGR